MKNPHYIDRSQSAYSKTPSLSKQLISKTLQTSNYKNQRFQTMENHSQNDLDDFFDKFHETFVVLQMKQKQPKTKTKRETKTTDSAKNKLLIKTYVPKVNKELKITKQNISINKKQKKTIKSTLKMNKTCKSEKNILKNTQNNNRVSTKKVSEKKSQAAHSKTKPQMKESKRQTTKKHILGTGSTTATTTLGNSGINLKEDIHISSYLRIKVRAK